MRQDVYYTILIAGTILLALIISIILRKLVNLSVKKYSKVIKTDPTNFSFLKNAIPFIVFSIAIIFIFYKIPFLKSIGTALFAGAGIFAAILGFASQKAFSNIISGIFILIFKPFRVGDTLEASNSQKGVVEEITLRHTIIKDYENRRIVVPNNQISDDVLINSSIADESIRKFVEFGISYDSDVDKAILIIQEEARKHPYFIDNRTKEEKAKKVPPVLVRMVGHGDFSINLRAYVWCPNNDTAFALQCDLLYSVKKRFDHEGIEIPFPYRTLVFKKDIETQPAEDH
ncbi:MAG: mechanosensitive ion channel family protein [Ignavibacteriales bacterium]|nr:mechanosensitive ion channel family protein [Ignavibacteriales bacterium]MCF8367543.1 mechanosensitive ion channel family protein [Bacteroidales bacterium]MCF8402648.1 mechanosensitive ion channel family protein [Bacteroidales bacterium]